MNSAFKHLLADVPAQEGNGGMPLAPSVSASKAKSAAPVSALDKTAETAKRLLTDEAQARAEKTARLKAARAKRDQGDEG